MKQVCSHLWGEVFFPSGHPGKLFQKKHHNGINDMSWGLEVPHTDTMLFVFLWGHSVNYISYLLLFMVQLQPDLKLFAFNHRNCLDVFHGGPLEKEGPCPSVPCWLHLESFCIQSWKIFMTVIFPEPPLTLITAVIQQEQGIQQWQTEFRMTRP